MFWNKKEEKELPDLPPIKSPFNREFSQVKSSTIEQPPVKETNEKKEVIADNMNEEEQGEGETEKHSLPSFPDSPIAKGFSQAAIKDAINQDEIKEEKNDFSLNIADKIESSQNKKFKTIEMEESNEETSKTNPFLTSIKASNTKNKKEKATINYNPAYSLNESPSIGLPPTEEEPEVEQEPVINKNPAQKGDIFVKIDKFFSAKKALDSIDDQVSEIDSLLNKIRETKLKEEKELANWEKQITLIKSRIQNINDNIFEKTQ